MIAAICVVVACMVSVAVTRYAVGEFERKTPRRSESTWRSARNVPPVAVSVAAIGARLPSRVVSE